MPPQPRAPRSILLTLAVALCGVLCAATSASAATRFAAPGGTGVDPCANPADPCTFFLAASGEAAGSTVKAGDEVVLASGEYSDGPGDLGPEGAVRLKPGISVHGAAGQPRPVIRLNRLSGGLVVEGGDSASHLEIATARSTVGVLVLGGTVKDLIVRSSAGPSTGSPIACAQLGGTIRDSACLASGAGATALGATMQSSAASTIRLRNVTAIATGAGSAGLSFQLIATSPIAKLSVLAKSVIAKGTSNDVFAAGLSSPPQTPGTGAEIEIVLDHSDYATAGTLTDAGGGRASVTLPGSPTNVMEPPLLAADGYHQLPGSPTVETGAADEFSGAADLDGQLRTIGAGTDIGADELGHGTVADVSCVPAPLTIGTGPSRCTATLTDTAPGADAPTGTVAFSSGGPGAFGERSCVLGPAIGARSSCGVTYTPDQIGSGVHAIEAVYPGDEVREPSRATASVVVSPPPGGGRDGGTPPPSPRPAPPGTTIAKKPAKRTTAARAKITFASDQAGSRFECRLDRRAFKRCASPFKATVRPGTHTFSVRAVSPQGVADPTPATYRWSVLRR